LDEPAAEHVELVRVGDVPVQADGEELGEHVDVVEPAVDAVGDWDVDEPVLAGDGDGRLGAGSGERVEAGAAAAAQDEREDGSHGERTSKTRVDGHRSDGDDNLGRAGQLRTVC